MNTTKVDKTELLEIVRKNRKKHEKEYKKARKKWVTEATFALQEAATKAEEDGEITMFPLNELPKPEHYLNDFDQVIRRLELEVENEVELDDRQFNAWVLNHWDWSRAFVANTSLYNG